MNLAKERLAVPPEPHQVGTIKLEFVVVTYPILPAFNVTSEPFTPT